MNSPLYRNGYALITSGGLSSVLGLAYWILAAHRYPPQVVGRDSAIISTMLLISGISHLNLDAALVRFIPIAGDQSRKLILICYAVATSVSLILSLIFTLGVHYFFNDLGFLSFTFGFVLAFILSITAWGVFYLQDSILIGLREAVWVPVENIAFAVAKILLVVAFAHLMPDFGIFGSWTISGILLILPVNALIFLKLLPRHSIGNKARSSYLRGRSLARYVAGNYAGSLFFLASTTLLPVIITSQVSARANAHFYLAWIISTALPLISLNLSTSLTVEAAIDVQSLSLYCYRIAVLIFRLLVPSVVIIVVGAPFLLLLFGSEYRIEGSSLLRLLALSSLPNVLVVLYLSIARVQDRAGSVAVVQGILCALILSGSLLLLRPLGVTGVAVAFLSAQVIVATGVMVLGLGNILRVGRRAHRTISSS